MGTSRHKPKRCETCIFYKSSDLKGQGWCTHPNRQQSGGMLLLVRAGALDCRNSWGEDFWTPADDETAASVARSAPPPSSSPPRAGSAQVVPVPTVEDHVVRQDAIMHHTTSSTPDDDESVNHAALSDQEERAQVIARGAREAIQAARQRKKEQFARSRQPHTAPLPSADTEAGEWMTTTDRASDDVVLSTRPQTIDPFKRSYGAPQPPVPSQEMPRDTGGIVSRYQDDRFDSVPEIRDEVELPRPAHFRGDGNQELAEDDLATDGAELSPNADVTSYDLVLQRARRFQRRSGTRSGHRTITPPQRSVAEASVVAVGKTPETVTKQADPAAPANLDVEPAWASDAAPEEQAVAIGGRAIEGADEDVAPVADEFVMPDWDNDPDVSWITTPARANPGPKPERRRLHLPQLNLWRHQQRERPALAASALAEDDIVEETVWNAPPVPHSIATVDDDPDWVEEVVPVEAYAAAQPEASPADTSADAYVETAWEDEWDHDGAEAPATTADVHGYAASARDFGPTSIAGVPGDVWDEDDWPTLLPADRVTGEATVRHRPQPVTAPFDFTKIRARLFARDDVQDAPAPANADGLSRRAERPQPTRRQPLSAAPRQSPDPDEDPDPDPGSGIDAALPSIEQHWREPQAEFDLRAVVRRQDELLDMRIQLAPDVPRACRSCRSFRAAEGGERGWCTNEWAFSHRRMVNADDLPCESSIGCWWLPADSVCLPADDFATLTAPTPLVDRLLGRLPLPGFDEFDEAEPRRARAR